METSTILFAFSLTLFAGLSTGIGSALAFFVKKSQPRFLALALGFSAGVMIYVSFVEIIPKAFEALSEVYSDHQAYLFTTLAFFGGILITTLIDKLVPSFENPHEPHRAELISSRHRLELKEKGELYRMGVFSAIAIAVHNFPEGLATFIAAIKDPSFGIAIALAISIHNIPEGIAVSVPIYYATGSRKKAFALSFLSGLAEPVGALLGFLFLMPFLNDQVLGITFAAVAGIMVFISLDELLPTSEKYGEHHLSMYGLIGGMAVMALSLVLMY